jgi:uncharacterized membrane protein
LRVFLLAALAFFSEAVPAFAVGDGSFYAVTPYMGMIAFPGRKYDFEVSLENRTKSIRQAALAVASLPEGWDACFDINGKMVTDVAVKPENQLYMKFIVTVPDDAPEGDNYVVSTFEDEDGLQEIRYKLTIRRERSSSLRGRIEVQFPELTGPSGAVFTYRVTYNNDSSENRSFSLASRTPDGWTVRFKPMYDSKTVASIVVDAHGTQILDVDVIPPANVEAGRYEIPIAFLSERETIAAGLFLVVEGTMSLKISTKNERLNMDAYAGQESVQMMIAANTGTALLRDVKLTASPPSNWSATFDTDTLTLLPGESAEILMSVKPSDRAVAGDYMLNIKGSNYGVRSSADIRVTVKTPVYWGFVGVLCIFSGIAVLRWMFRKFGRK